MKPAKYLALIVLSLVTAGCAGMTPTQQCSVDSCEIGPARVAKISYVSGADFVAGTGSSRDKGE